MPKKSPSPNSPSEYIVEHTRFVPKTGELSPANQNWARKTLILRQFIRTEHEKTLEFRQPIKNRVLRHPSRQPIRI